MSRMRIGGLASGMDTDMMVQSLMKVERMKVDRFQQSKQIALWRQESYNNMNKMFANFILNTKRDMGLQKVGSAGITNINLSRLDYVKQASVSDPTKANVSVTAGAVNGSFELEIKQLASGASFTSKDMRDVTLEGEITFSINGEEELTVDATADKDATMNAIAKKINDQKENGVTAFYDKDNGRLFMQSTETGKDIRVSGGLAGLVGIELDGDGNINLDENGNALVGVENEEGVVEYKASGAVYNKSQEAKVILNGVELKYKSNNINLNGVNIQLKGTTEAGSKLNIKVDTNVEGIMDKVKKLVADYNELIDKISEAVGEKRFSSYHPLSQEEKNAMHESDVKLWEEKARSGMLSNDPILGKVLQDMRSQFYLNDTGALNLYSLGINTESYAMGKTGGKLQIDEDKLRAAIMEDPDNVMQSLFAEGEKDSEGKVKKSTQGVFNRIYDSIISGMESIVDKSGPGKDADLLRAVKFNLLTKFNTSGAGMSDIDREINATDRRIDSLNESLFKKEDAYYAKFAAMEKMLQKMYGQSSWIGQQMM